MACLHLLTFKMAQNGSYEKLEMKHHLLFELGGLLRAFNPEVLIVCVKRLLRGGASMGIYMPQDPQFSG